MRTLTNHVILYDDGCPMCDLYTHAFVATGMLPEKGRVPFSNADQKVIQCIDPVRACNEIALVDLKSGTTTYGLASLTKILETRYRFLGPVFRTSVFQVLMKRLYSFISYNRKVIIPAAENISGNTCRPSFNLKYRISYLVFAWLTTSVILTKYASLLTPLIPMGNGYREFAICGGQILFQALIIRLLGKTKMLEYLGNMMTISLGGSLLLLAVMPFRNLIHSPIFYVACFLFVAFCMFLEHIRRTRMLKLSWMLSASWVVYRLLVVLLLYVLS
jgi:hypothetical protein